MGKDYEQWLGAYGEQFRVRGLDRISEEQQTLFEGLVFDTRQQGMASKFRLTSGGYESALKGISNTTPPIRREAVIGLVHLLYEELGPPVKPIVLRSKGQRFFEWVRGVWVDLAGRGGL